MFGASLSLGAVEISIPDLRKEGQSTLHEGIHVYIDLENTFLAHIIHRVIDSDYFKFLAPNSSG